MISLYMDNTTLLSLLLLIVVVSGVSACGPFASGSPEMASMLFSAIMVSAASGIVVGTMKNQKILQ